MFFKFKDRYMKEPSGLFPLQVRIEAEVARSRRGGGHWTAIAKKPEIADLGNEMAKPG